MLDLVGSPYLTELTDREAQLKPRLDSLLDEAALAIVGKGYIDIIIAPARVDGFLIACTQFGVAVTLITLWCDCTVDNRSAYGCPHGYGGPGHGDGFLSELCEEDYHQADDHGITAPQSSDEVTTDRVWFRGCGSECRSTG